MYESKHHNKRVKGADGFVYDSKHERSRYAELCLLQRAGKIKDLKRQVKIKLLPVQRDEKGKIIERGVSYFADFTYIDENGNTVVEDAKGQRTKDYILKRKMALYLLGIRIKEV